MRTRGWLPVIRRSLGQDAHAPQGQQPRTFRQFTHLLDICLALSARFARLQPAPSPIQAGDRASRALSFCVAVPYAAPHGKDTRSKVPTILADAAEGETHHPPQDQAP